jgi:uncharacterized membrane protein (DUF106 family)
MEIVTNFFNNWLPEQRALAIALFVLAVLVGIGFSISRGRYRRLRRARKLLTHVYFECYENREQLDDKTVEELNAIRSCLQDLYKFQPIASPKTVTSTPRALEPPPGA